MALKPCRECKKKVSTEATSCPSCGAPHPTAKATEKREPKFSYKFGKVEITEDKYKEINAETSNVTKKVNTIKKTSTALGLETQGGIFTELIAKNTPLPAEVSQIFSTSDDNQPAVTIRVFQRSSANAISNEKLDEFEFDKIPSAPKGVPQINVTFAIDKKANVTISSEDLDTKIKKKKHIGKIKTHQSSEVFKNTEKKESDDKYFFEGTKSLETTFWGYFFGANAIFQILEYSLVSNRAGTGTLYFIGIIHLIWLVLSVMGVFNSADFYKAEKIRLGQTYGIATAAKVATVVLILSAIGNAL